MLVERMLAFCDADLLKYFNFRDSAGTPGLTGELHWKAILQQRKVNRNPF